MRHVISIHHLYQTGLNVKDLYSIPDLSVAHWFRLRRNTLLDGSQVFLLSLFFLPSYTNVSHMETPPGMHFILVQHSAITPSSHTKN